MAIVFCTNGILLMLGKDLVNLRTIVGSAMIILSIAYLIYSFMGYSLKSKYAAKIKVTDESIELKSSFWKPLIAINWKDIRHIEFGNFSIAFELANETKLVTYNTSAEQSIQVKQLLRDTAGQRNVQVIGG